jgi:hypothetical protein
MKLNINWHALGISASLICAIHCALGPLLLSGLSLFGVNLIENIWIEIVLLGSAFIIGGTTLWHGFNKHHHQPAPLIFFSSGMALFLLNQFIEFPFSEVVFIVPGVTAIIYAHLKNYKYYNASKKCSSEHCMH